MPIVMGRVSNIAGQFQGRRYCGLCQAGLVPHDPYHSVTPRIVVDDVLGQVRFLRDVFGAAGEVVDGRPVELLIGDSLVMISGSDEREAFPAFLYVYVVDADAVHSRAVDAGATTIEAPFDTPYGDRRAMVKDPWDNTFQIAHRLATQ